MFYEEIKNNKIIKITKQRNRKQNYLHDETLQKAHLDERKSF